MSGNKAPFDARLCTCRPGDGRCLAGFCEVQSATRIHPERAAVEDVIQRVWRRFENEVGGDHQGSCEEARGRVGKWLAAVSYDEWFALVDAYRDAQDGVR